MKISDDISTITNSILSFIMAPSPVIILAIIILGVIPLILLIKNSIKRKIKQNKIKENYFKEYCRDIPCDKNILKIYYISVKNDIIENKYNIINTYILKWYYQKNIIIKNGNTIIFKQQPQNELDEKLYNLLKIPSKNDILPFSKLRKYMKKNYEEFELWYKIFWMDIEAKYYDLVTNEEISQVIGSKEFIKNFGYLDSKEIQDIHIWEAYLLCASIFGLTKKISNQTKDFNLFQIAMINPYMQNQSDYNIIKWLMNKASILIDYYFDSNKQSKY